MRDEYDFSGAIRNPYMAKYKNEVSIMLDDETLAFLKEQAVIQKIPYKTLASLFLSHCVKEMPILTAPQPALRMDESANLGK